MEPSTLYSQVSDFEERNHFLFLVLGLVSLSQGVIERLAPVPAQAAPTTGSDRAAANDAAEPHIRDLLF